jgi:hypothetical protein
MVARGLKRIRQAFENAFAVVDDRRCLAMHEAICADNLATEHVAHALVAQAYSEDRCAFAKSANDVAADARFVGRAGAWRNADAFWRESRDFIERDLVIAFHGRFGAEFAKVLDEVVGETVVVIDDEEHGGRRMSPTKQQTARSGRRLSKISFPAQSAFSIPARGIVIA